MMQAMEYRAGEAPFTLSHCALLAGLPPDSVREIEAACRWHACPPGSVVLSAAEKLDSIYFIASGSVRITGSPARFGPGEAFGELSAIDGGGRSAEAVSEADTVVALCPRDRFLAALEQHPALAMRLIRKLTGIIRNADSRRAAGQGGAAAPGAPEQVYAELLRLAVPVPGQPGLHQVSPAPRHNDLAAAAGTTPDLVARALAQAMRAGLVERRGTTLVVRDRDGLALLAGPAGR